MTFSAALTGGIGGVMFYNAHERERRFAEMLRKAEPSPEFLARCLRARVHIDAPTSSRPDPSLDGMPSANGGARQFP